MAKGHHLSREAFLARMAAGRAKKAKRRGGRKAKRKVGVKRAKKVVRAVAKITRTDEKKIKSIAHSIAKKAIQHHPTTKKAAVAEAAKRVADKCAKELKEVRHKAEAAFRLGSIGRGLRAATKGHGPKGRGKHHPKPHHYPIARALEKVMRERGHTHPLMHHEPFSGERAILERHSGVGGPAFHRAGPRHMGPMFSGPSQSLPRMGRKKGKRHAAPHGGHEISARTILGGASKMKAKGKKTRALNFWVCAGPVRTGCGHGGSFVLGDQTKHPAVRLR